MISKAVFNIGNGLDIIFLGCDDERHKVVADLGAIASLIVEGSAEVTHGDNQDLFDQIGVKWDARFVAEFFVPDFTKFDPPPYS